MKITRKSKLTGEMNTLDVPISQDDFDKGMERRVHGELIQDCFPGLSREYREFLMTGITPKEWAEYIE